MSNTAAVSGGALVFVGYVEHRRGVIRLTDSRVVGNTAGYGGGVVLVDFVQVS